ncbi:hypothetical protein ABT119_31465 [Streptomyces sp. NPDC001910]|uniref:hypothetical protein n=1 Tax=Streptomyces sp. NPDC001910 TaxID=3154403 RepID=UPI00332F5DD0
MTSTLVFGESDAVLVDALTTAAEAEALAARVQLHHRNLTGVFKRLLSLCSRSSSSVTRSVQSSGL